MYIYVHKYTINKHIQLIQKLTRDTSPFSSLINLMYNDMGREIYERYHASYEEKEDIHTKLMRRYKDIPSWWFYMLLGATLAVSFVLCIFLNDQVQMPWWSLLFAGAMAFIFTLPISIITATTNQVVWLLLSCLSLSYGKRSKIIIFYAAPK